MSKSNIPRTIYRTKCNYADQYKAKRQPTCGCEVCNLKWKLRKIINATLKQTEKGDR